MKKHYIGYIIMDDHARDQVPILMYMTPKGKRSYLFPYRWSNPFKFHPEHRVRRAQLLQWKRGGPFPPGFKPETNVLGKLLNDMVNKGLISTEL